MFFRKELNLMLTTLACALMIGMPLQMWDQSRELLCMHSWASKRLFVTVIFAPQAVPVEEQLEYLLLA
ncbi:MAG: hypothetical protein HY899_19625 [Deltaproteobacteria bacterium]|nr:hypothetical protein [Deltaproteobacteria bacterium]